MKAFPAYEWNEPHKQMMAVGGMDLRDYFAAKAMQSLLTHEHLYLYDQAEKTCCGDWDDYVVEMAYCVADKMIKAKK